MTFPAIKGINAEIRTHGFSPNSQLFKFMVIDVIGLSYANNSLKIAHMLPEHSMEMPRDAFLKLDNDTVKAYLREAMPKLAKRDLEGLTTQIRQFYVAKFKRRREPKYGTLERGFTDTTIKLFFRVIDDDKFYLLFRYQAMLGLRIGEAVKLSLANLELESRELRLKSEKSGRLDSLRIPEPLFSETLKYIRAYRAEIEQSHGYLFFPNPHKQGYGRKEPFLDVNYVRNRFRHYMVKAGLHNDIYDLSESQSENYTKRNLHLLTTHSLRHYAITRMAKATNGNLILTSRFARHSQPNTTMVYISKDKHDLYDAIDAATISDVTVLKNKVIINRRI